ncbi:MAG: hypothetical protein RLT05_26360 [Bauldia litoralis]
MRKFMIVAAVGAAFVLSLGMGPSTTNPLASSAEAAVKCGVKRVCFKKPQRVCDRKTGKICRVQRCYRQRSCVQVKAKRMTRKPMKTAMKKKAVKKAMKKN